jgi:hypothetical protein
MADMGLGPVGDESSILKRKYRWLLRIQDVSVDGVNALPPSKSARPSLTFKEIEAQHLNETIYFAGKPEWKPLPLTLYDFQKNENPVFEWLKEQYDPQTGDWFAPPPSTWKKPEARLEMLDGCGDICETWVYENVWPQSIEWGDLDMGNSEYCTVDLQLRYDRAFIES